MVCLIVFILNFTKDSSSLSLLEKNWISNNKSNVIDVSVYNDVPVYGMDGDGMIFSFLDEFTNSYGIQFNKISYLNDGNTNLKNTSFRILNYNDKLNDNDIILYKDSYVLVNRENISINDMADLNDKSVGVIDEDITDIRYFINVENDIKFSTYKDKETLIGGLKNKEVDYIAVPKNLYLNEIIENDLYISYHLNEMYKNYVLTINKDKTLKSIMKKYLMAYQKEYEEDKYREYLLDSFFKFGKISEAEKMGYNASEYVFGYIVNMPYENMINKEFVGTISNYLSEFEDLADVDFKMIGYKNIMELKQAFSRGEIDVLFANFNTDGINIDVKNTTSPFAEKYVILSKDNYIVNSIRSLKGKEIYTVSQTYLYDYLVKNGITAKGFDDTDNLFRNISNDSIVMIDMDTYEYYRDKKFKDYKIIYEGMIDKDYTFAIRDVNKNNTFSKLFSYYIDFNDYKNIKYKYNTNSIVNSKNEVGFMIKCAIYIVGGVLLTLLILYLIIRKKNKKENITKDDKLKFIDMMTSLKNRNYLNYNIKTWDENVIYPQAIVIIDLNNIKYVNDNYGHAEGDVVIKKAASILINNQEDNTDIVRTDGNEFLVYMVGYDEKKVQEYVRKINKEMKELPHEFGATFGYSMITDDVKTIDDAINEATLSMRQAKERL